MVTSWVLDIQDSFNRQISEEKQTRIAKLVSLGVGIIAIIVSMILANREIKSAYEWFNIFMGLVLGVLGIFVLGVITKKATNIGSYTGFFTFAIIGYIINLIYLAIKKNKNQKIINR